LGLIATARSSQVRLASRYDPGLRRLAGEHPGDAAERPAGAIAHHEVVEPLAAEVLDDLPGGGALVHVGVGRILELPGVEPAVPLRQLHRLLHQMLAYLATAFLLSGSTEPSGANLAPAGAGAPGDRVEISWRSRRARAGLAGDRDRGTFEVVDSYAQAAARVENHTPTGPQLDMATTMPMVKPRLVSVPTRFNRGRYGRRNSPAAPRPPPGRRRSGAAC
jgi:hypothetical protein